MGHTLKVFALVDETPEKVDKNVKTINEDETPIGAMASSLSVEPPALLTPLSSSTASASNKIPLCTPVRSPSKKFWNNESDSSQCSDDSSENEVDNVHEDLKRKASEKNETVSTGNNQDVTSVNKKRRSKKDSAKSKSSAKFVKICKKTAKKSFHGFNTNG